jgi:putative two-component system response regulator
VLVIDDERAVRELMLELLAFAGYDAIGAEDAERGTDLLADTTFSLVVSDINMPGLSGLELLDRIRTHRPSLPVVLVTGAATPDTLTSALALGADGLVPKPFGGRELLAAVETALERSRRAESEVRGRLLTPTLASALAKAIETRQPSLQGHCERLCALAVRLAQELGLSEAETEVVRLGSILHDVGKIGIPDRVLLKRGPLTPEELAGMRLHTLIGDRLLAPLELLQDVRPVVRHHHERWDGTGYPDGLTGEAIPVPTRVVAVADAIEAMSAERSYRSPLTEVEILRELRAGRGTQWEPRAIDAALELIASGELRLDPPGPRLPAAIPVAAEAV